jgi:ABC-type transport system involved in Fe-S cluster assembly fused permease/ATPase subunit
MDKRVQQLKILNEVYRDMRKNFTTLKKMFDKDSNIKQKTILAERMTEQIYMSIMQKLESEEIYSEFNKIVKDIHQGDK